MKGTPTKILVADNDSRNRCLIVDYLQKAGYDVTGVKDGEDALSVLNNQDYSVAVIESTLPKADGFAFIEKTKQIKPEIAVLVLTDNPTVDTAVTAMKLGAEDYMCKPVDPEEIGVQIYKALEKQKSKNGSYVSPQQPDDGSRFGGIIGESEPMSRVFRLMDKVADDDSTVIIYGESGTGKELIARSMHFNSRRNTKPLIPVNCGAIPEELLESELFGHEKGAFTGAHKARIGRFELADGGTIFLDEIGDMSPNLQVKILRVLQEREFERVGGVRPIKVDIRIIAATHRDLEKAVAEEKFRQDLYYRLNVIPIDVPPLRERKSDISLLVAHFINHFNRTKGKNTLGISDNAFRCFVEYDWPGNVRELQNIIERLVTLHDGGMIDMDDLPAKLLTDGSETGVPFVDIPSEGMSFNTMVTNFEKQLIHQALKKTSGVKNKAAQLLNMNRTTLVEKMKKLQIKYNE